MTNAYELLGVPQDADTAQIRAAYRNQAKRLHPDLHGSTDAAHDRFVQLQAAYQVLIDPDRRAAHDLDPDGTLQTQVWQERRKAQLRRRKERLRRLYTD